MEDLSLLAGQAAQYGFPMVISWYLLVRMEEKLENLTQSIERLGGPSRPRVFIRCEVAARWVPSCR